MPAIDYKAYVKSLGSFEYDPKSRVKDYLDKLAAEDESFKALYFPDKIDDCYNFITNAVKQMPRGNAGCIAVEDAVVWKIARDYFIDILPKGADEQPEVKAADPEAEEEVETEAETPSDNESGVDIENSGSSNPRETDSDVEEKAMPQAKEGESQGIVTDEYGFEVYGETEPEEGAETAEEVETEAETPSDNESGVDIENSGSSNPRETEPENEKPESSGEVKYDEAGNGLLFDFD